MDQTGLLHAPAAAARAALAEYGRGDLVVAVHSRVHSPQPGCCAPPTATPTLPRKHANAQKQSKFNHAGQGVLYELVWPDFGVSAGRAAGRWRLRGQRSPSCALRCLQGVGKSACEGSATTPLWFLGPTPQAALSSNRPARLRSRDLQPIARTSQMYSHN